MVNRVTEILIGKDIDRDAQVTASTSMTTLQDTGALQNGELVALDKNMLVLVPGATVSDTDTIYIAQGTGTTFNVTNEAGTLDSANYRIILSHPIQAGTIKSYKGESYVAKVEQAILWDVDDASFTVTPDVDQEYVLRIVYSDITEYPTRFTQTYRAKPSAATEAALIWALGRKVQQHAGSRVTCNIYQTDGATAATGVANANQLKLTAKPIPSCTTGLNDIDEFSMVRFTAQINSVGTSTDPTLLTETVEVAYSDGTETANVQGTGNWERIRDLEKYCMGYEGVSNFTHFPVVKPDFRTSTSSTYHQIVIEHNPKHLSPYPSDSASDPVTTVIACVVPSSGTQLNSLLAQLNPWFASCPGAFANISF